MDYHGTTGNDITVQATLGIPDNSNIYGDAGDDSITIGFANAIGGPGSDTIIGTSGGSSAAYWDSPQAVSVDLQAGQALDGFGTVDKLISIYSILGSSYSDTLLGSNGDDRFWGSRGDDHIDGRGGVNSVSFFFEPPSRLNISYDTATRNFTVSNSDPNSPNYGTKTLTNIQILQFSGDGSGNSSIALNSYIPNYTISFNGKAIPVSVAGIWTPVNTSDPVTHNAIPVANAFYSQIGLANGRNGLVLDGWAYDGWDNTDFYTVNAALLEQNVDGTLTIATVRHISDPVTNGSGSALVADFNGDGKPDIFLAAHNESPSIPKSSTAYISNANGTFTNVSLADSVEAHGGVIANLQGLPTVFTASYGGEGDPYFQYRNGAFVETTLMSGQSRSIGGSSVNCADFDADGQPDLVISDHNFGPGYPYSASAAPVIAVYKLADVAANSGAPEAILTPYFNGKQQYANVPNLFGNGTTHEPRLWVDDFNHDGKPDILGSALMWTSDAGMEFAMLQMFQNTSTSGSVSFADRTDSLNREYDVRTDEVDKAMQIIDIDHSGIAAYFQAGSTSPYNQDGSPQSTMQNNYILLNDGTGRLHTYMHDQFQSLGEQVNVYAAQTNAGQPRFIAYLTPDNTINFVAEFGITDSSSGNRIQRQEFVNVPLQMNPTLDYLDNITVADRNNSMLMRTWAGNDTINDTNASASATGIDGGLGVDTCSYSDVRSHYQLAHSGSGTWTITKQGAVADTITNVERLQFADTRLAIDMGVTQAGGEVALLIGAVLGNASLTNKTLAGQLLTYFDTGKTMHDAADVLVNAGVMDQLAGGSSTGAYVDLIFHAVTGQAATPGVTAALAPYIDSYGYSKADFLATIAGMQINQDNVGLVGLGRTGLEFS